MWKLSWNIVPNVYNSLQSSFLSLAWPWPGRSLPQGNQWECWYPWLGPHVVGLQVHLPPLYAPDTPCIPWCLLNSPEHPLHPLRAPNAPWCPLYPFWPQSTYSPCQPQIHPWHPLHPLMPPDTPRWPHTPSTSPRNPQWPLMPPIHLLAPEYLQSLPAPQYTPDSPAPQCPQNVPYTP